MGQDDYFAHATHDRQDGALVKGCEWWQRLETYYPGWSWLGENIAAGYSTPSSVVAGWMSSSGHRANILNPDNWELGVGYYTGGGSWSRYWVQTLGRRSGVYPVIINSEAYSTSNRAVQLYVYGPSSAERMRFSSDGATWSAWQTYTPHTPWTLADGDTGTRSVHAQIDTGLQTLQASEDIHFVSTAPVLAIDPTALRSLTAQRSGTCLPATHTVRVSNAGGGALDWGASEDSVWLEIAQGADTFTVTCAGGAVGAFGPGTQTATITVSAAGATDSPQDVAVTLVVAPEIYPFFTPLVARYRP